MIIVAEHAAVDDRKRLAIGTGRALAEQVLIRTAIIVDFPIIAHSEAGNTGRQAIDREERVHAPTPVDPQA